jgi:hypothetical protein
MSILIQEPGKLNPFLEDLTVKTNLKDRMEALRALLTSRHVLVGVGDPFMHESIEHRNYV